MPDYRIGFVGVGRMGSNMARHLKDEGYTISAAYDVDGSRSAELASELGCEAASTPAGVAEASDTVITVVTDDDAMRAVFAEGADGLLEHAEGVTFINCATISPSVHVEVEGLVEARGGHSLEACMASSITQAREGTLYLMCGGKRAVFDAVEPLLKTLSVSLRYVGEAGRAAQVKALVNMVMNINTAALAEGLGLADALGLDLTTVQEVFAQTGANSRVLETDGEDMQARDHECYFSSAHAAKDSGIALALADEEGLDLPLSKATYEQYRRMIEVGKGDLDKSGVAELTFRGRNRPG
ncbi:NAD(P)-dependent oxidoreductase [Candidatus Poribacteria bacterium]|jgi:3-hydroxyisobutyrate dehydrogenase|nr:NAD(P)-dependent oxidoreductase [Candidatus Poribacteria bacterium]MBT5713292.1 NAD(P)-dependent oxidoreductase [Candidatus Poribacteria bacterium]MBT7098576.1 NAD(P)-dependent oxidoreductase [Candidatus Poribacteria bacterium]MBT7804296.1 NAD(P)-dependent oxidoreductase [Candidatus Poribacteria bacterium]